MLAKRSSFKNQLCNSHSCTNTANITTQWQRGQQRACTCMSCGQVPWGKDSLATELTMRARAERTRDTFSENMSWDRHCCTLSRSAGASLFHRLQVEVEG